MRCSTCSDCVKRKGWDIDAMVGKTSTPDDRFLSCVEASLSMVKAKVTDEATARDFIIFSLIEWMTESMPDINTDLDQKHELTVDENGNAGPIINTDDTSPEELMALAKFAEDIGWNNSVKEMQQAVIGLQRSKNAKHPRRFEKS